MNIGIIGSGNIGSTLAGYLTDLGHEVMISNSRGPESLSDVAHKTEAVPVTTQEAAKAKDLIIIAIPAKAIGKLPTDLLRVSNAIVIDAGNYYPSRDGQIAEIGNGLTDSEWVAKVIAHPVIKAFNNILAASLASKAVPVGSEGRVALSVAGDDNSQKETVIKLIEEIGFDAIDGGVLAESWRQQPGTPAYCKDLNKEDLHAALAKAEMSKREAYRAEADEMARPYL